MGVCSTKEKVVIGAMGVFTNLLAGQLKLDLPDGSMSLDLGAGTKYELELLCSSKAKAQVFNLGDNLSQMTAKVLLSTLGDKSRAAMTVPPGGMQGKYFVTPGFNPSKSVPGFAWLNVDLAVVAWYERSPDPGMFKLNVVGFRPTGLGLSLKRDF